MPKSNQPYQHRKEDPRPVPTKSTSSEMIVYAIGPYDVLMGRGAPITDNPGNVKFRQLVKERLPLYLQTKIPQERHQIAVDIVNEIHARGGRFLRKMTKVEKDTTNQPATTSTKELASVSSSDNAQPAWTVVGNEKELIVKAKQLLRDMEPESMSRRVERRRYRYRKLGTETNKGTDKHGAGKGSDTEERKPETTQQVSKHSLSDRDGLAPLCTSGEEALATRASGKRETGGLQSSILSNLLATQGDTMMRHPSSLHGIQQVSYGNWNRANFPGVGSTNPSQVSPAILAALLNPSPSPPLSLPPAPQRLTFLGQGTPVTHTSVTNNEYNHLLHRLALSNQHSQQWTPMSANPSMHAAFLPPVQPGMSRSAPSLGSLMNSLAFGLPVNAAPAFSSSSMSERLPEARLRRNSPVALAQPNWQNLVAMAAPFETSRVPVRFDTHSTPLGARTMPDIFMTSYPTVLTNADSLAAQIESNNKSSDDKNSTDRASARK